MGSSPRRHVWRTLRSSRARVGGRRASGHDPLLALLLACAGGACTPRNVTPDSPAATASPTQTLRQAAHASDRAYALLETLCTDFGPRLSGSENLERAIAWAEGTLREAGHANVRVEPVQVPKWIRGRESLTLLPAETPIEMIGLGRTVATPAEGIEAEVVVVHDWDDLQRRKDDVAGKIVLFDVHLELSDGLPNYGELVQYRVEGADAASALGARAMLIRSLTTDPGSPPHTGALVYAGDAPSIPAAAVSWTAADRLVRLADAAPPRVRLVTEGHFEPDARSGNVVAEIVGTTAPEEIVVFGGHLDSWDVGQGAHDNGAGVAISMAVLDLVRAQDLRPRRTLRLVLWTNEENGGEGSKAYARAHGDERHVAAVESDIGGAPVIELTLQDRETPMPPDPDARPRGYDRIAALAESLADEGVRGVRPFFAGADIAPLIAVGVPGIGMFHDPTHYFDVHHAANDTLDRIDPEALQQSVAVMASVVYALADDEATLAASPPAS